MGVVFFLGFVIFFIVFAIFMTAGIAAIVLGILGLSKSKKRVHSGKKPLKGLSISGIVIGALILSSPLILFSVAGISSTFLPENVTITDVVIDEYGYQSDKFTAGGVTYVALDGFTTDASFYTKADAVFTYKYSDSIFDRSLIGNYYSVSNPYGFDLVCDEYGNLFCPEDDAEAIEEKFNSMDRYIWMVKGKKFSDEATSLFEAFIEDPAIKGTYITMDYFDAETINILKMTPDGIVEIYDYDYTHSVLIYEDEVYYIRSEEFSEDGGEDVVFNVVPMPPVIAEEILTAYNN